MSENDAAPVSHQKQPHQNATNAIEIEQKRGKINEADRYSAAHNGLVAGSSPAGPTTLRPSGYAWRSQAETEGETCPAKLERRESEDGLTLKRRRRTRYPENCCWQPSLR
jgi:hypothetical protein